ncbi:hypothetical protein LIER_41385 [Lithospermum erythrorhizon]|uniref:Uncharacterized protein n=1 Tax=Lithospermum erythrorhizon TaxID=34254 RepID=A0AAV3R9T4_LITER
MEIRMCLQQSDFETPPRASSSAIAHDEGFNDTLLNLHNYSSCVLSCAKAHDRIESLLNSFHRVLMADRKIISHHRDPHRGHDGGQA